MRIGVLLGGCGLYDGTDVHEAVLTMLALEEAGERPVLLAPARPQDRTVDHLTGNEVEGESRGTLRESARLARGRITALDETRPDHLQALIIPGGYGPVVNLCSGFARRGEGRQVIPEAASFIGHFLETRKPIGLVSLGEIPVRMLLGEAIETAPVPGDPRQPRVDRARRIVHTPGFAAFTRMTDVRIGIEAMVREVLALIEERARAIPSSPASVGEGV